MTAHERTSWRDEWPSMWHRQIGSNFPMCDVDALLYHYLQPVALFDWKRGGTDWSPTEASIEAQCNLANGFSSATHPNGLPFFVVEYWSSDITFRAFAINREATLALTATQPPEGNYTGAEWRTMNEAQFVALEGELRGLSSEQVRAAIAQLKTTDLPQRTRTGSATARTPFTYSEHAHAQRTQPHLWNPDTDTPPEGYRQVH